MRFLLHLLLPTLLLLACGGGSPLDSASNYALEATEAGVYEEIEQMDQPGTPLPPADRKIIRSGNLTYEVDDLEAARNAIVQHVQQVGGYVEGDDRNDWGSSENLTMRVRIPAESFDAFVDGLNTLGRLEHRSINAVDVTTEWVDVEARLAAKRTLEQRYLELATQAKNVNEMLEVERGLAEVRGEIESMEARMKSLRDQVAMSSLTITCSKQVPMVQRYTPRFGIAFKQGWNNLLRFTVWLANLWPFVILIGVLVWWWRRRRSRRKG